MNTAKVVVHIVHSKGGNIVFDLLRERIGKPGELGKLVPMVVVMGNGNVPDFGKELLDNIVPAARAAYHISSGDPRSRIGSDEI